MTTAALLEVMTIRGKSPKSNLDHVTYFVTLPE